MALTVAFYGDPILRRKADPILEITPEIRALAEEMKKKMISLNGVGLAAPQIGHSLRLFVLQEEILTSSGDYVLGSPEIILNPIFSSPSEEMQTDLEGCLSIPKIRIEVTRPQKIHVRYQNLLGESKEELLEGHRARIFMHENDHLNGTLMIDRADPKTRQRIEPLLRKIKSR